MNQSTIPTPAKYQLRRAAARGLPTVFFVAVCGLSALLWQFQNRSSVFVGEVEVMEYLVASPQQGVVSQLIPSDGAELDVYVSVKKDQLLIQLDDSPPANSWSCFKMICFQSRVKYPKSSAD